jgi:NAD(P)H-flavin reductase
MYKTKILSITDEANNVKTFKLERPTNLNFVSGQYSLLSYGSNTEKKPFTFSSSPETKDYFTLTVKKMGAFTSGLFMLRPGDVLGIDGPFGEDLSFDGSIKDDVSLIAGGSGITPLMSIIRYVVDKNLANQVTLIFGNQSEKDIIFYKELDKIKKEHKNIKVIHVLSRPDDRWKGERGYISEEIIKRYISKPQKNQFFVCGPPPMNRSMEKILKGIKVKKIHMEAWELPGKSG